MNEKLARTLFQRGHLKNKKFLFARPLLDQTIDGLLGVLYPHFGKQNIQTADDLALEIASVEVNLRKLLKTVVDSNKARRISDRFFSELGVVAKKLDLDVQATMEFDPAAESVDEVVFCYPGFLAIAIQRMAHILYQKRVPLFPRSFTEYAHRVTGIDIHPGACIGNHFFIDHGTGVVIGETCDIGNRVKIYQGVTLGALSVGRKLRNHKRHPTLEDNVTIYSNATILGGETVIGKNSIIGGNVWVTKSVPPNSKIYHK